MIGIEGGAEELEYLSVNQPNSVKGSERESHSYMILRVTDTAYWAA